MKKHQDVRDIRDVLIEKPRVHRHGVILQDTQELLEIATCVQLRSSDDKCVCDITDTGSVGGHEWEPRGIPFLLFPPHPHPILYNLVTCCYCDSCFLSLRSRCSMVFKRVELLGFVRYWVSSSACSLINSRIRLVLLEKIQIGKSTSCEYCDFESCFCS